MAQIKVVSNIEGNVLEWDRVVWGDRGQGFYFEVSPFGTAGADQVITEIGNIDGAQLKELIEQKVGVVRENNPALVDVNTDDGGANSASFPDNTTDSSADDGVNDSDRYGWCREGQLYTVTVV